MMSELSAGPAVADGRKRDWDEGAIFADPFVVATSPEEGMDDPLLPEHADSSDKAASVASTPPRRQRICELI